MYLFSLYMNVCTLVVFKMCLLYQCTKVFFCWQTRSAIIDDLAKQVEDSQQKDDSQQEDGEQ